MEQQLPTPVAVPPERKKRSDAGKPRGPYRPRTKKTVRPPKPKTGIKKDEGLFVVIFT